MRLLILFTLCCLSVRAVAQDTRETISLQDQIAELRQELQLMQQAQQSAGQPQPYAPPPPMVESPGGPPASSSGGNDTTAELLVRVGALEEANRTLQGRVDELTNQLQRQNDALSKQIGDLAFKLGQAPGGAAPGGSGPAAGTPPADSAPAPEAPPAPKPERRTPEMALREGNAALARRDYDAAAGAAREVLAGGHSVRTTDAYFLLARAEGGKHDYKASAADFYRAYKNTPKSPVAPLALLGVANAFIAMDDNTHACQALLKVSSEFKAPGADVKARLVDARHRAQCK